MLLIRYAVITILIFITMAVNVGMPDSPHNNTNNITCLSCHTLHGALGPSFTKYAEINNLCKSCHYDAGPAPYVETHQPQDDGGEPITITCAVCHNPHTQEQNNAYGTTYGKLIRTQVETPNSGTKDVKFIAATGPNSFADGDGIYDGICEVCHTQTTYHRNSNEADHAHNVGVKCTSCHQHVNRFMGMGGGAHSTHVTAEYGPNITCSGGDLGCHGAYSPPLFADGQDLTNTTVCDNCHSVDGAAIAKDPMKDYWNNPGSSEGAEGSWAAVEGEASFCGSCHDATFGNTEIDGSGNNATNVMGDNLNYGFSVTGHGKESGNYTRLSWQDTSASGNPAANKPCSSCHEPMSQHYGSSNKRSKQGYENDNNNSNCQQCHDPGTVAIGEPQWYTTYTAYDNSAHGTANVKCTECHDVHGATGAYAAMTKGNKQNLCYQCHTQGVVQNDALSGSIDDIQEAFSMGEKHDLGTSFSLGSKTYQLQCSSCHNVHIVTGKHWEVDQGKSPVTRFTNNTVVWGDEAGEKMDDFAAQASGTGGWYYSKARGGVLSSDQPAVYQPPKAGSGYNFEFDGDVMPDYTTFCLDCHSSTMSASVYPINWGQGIGWNYSGNPTTWVTARAPHGLNSANKPYYWGDVGMYGSSGNPDPIFSESGVTRGRGAGHFMRWPYDSVNKNAGINFVMSCTDCHEAHGSGAASMLRSTVNAYGPGTSNWNTMCNNCHYYYGGQHAGMSCAYASCHEQQSIHRIKKNGEYSGGTYLWTEPSRPTTTPEIASVEGILGSNELTVTFTEGVYTNANQTGAVEPGDFLLTDVNGDNPRSITWVTHTPGDSTATITMSAPLIAVDTDDLLATRGVSIWDLDGDPAGPWTVTTSICPGATSFQLNEPAGSTTATDETGLLVGTVNNPSVTLPGDGYFHGDENQSTWIDFDSNLTCLMSPYAVTIEARVKPTAVDLDWEDANGDGIDDIPDRNTTFNRIFERKRNIKITIMHTWYSGDEVPERNDKARIQVKYFVDTDSRHTCPDPQWPDDPYEGNDSRWHQINTDIDQWPIVNDHWYKIKVVFNSDKSGIPGSDGTPVDIFIDDQGPNGDDVGENWSGYVNASMTINESSSCKWGALPGDFIATEDQPTYIGSPPNHDAVSLFKGLIDWITWQPVADYSGVDGSPH